MKPAMKKFRGKEWTNYWNSFQVYLSAKCFNCFQELKYCSDCCETGKDVLPWRDIGMHPEKALKILLNE